jgi:hypothetical protein
MMDLQFLLFLLVLWFISWIIKKLPKQEQEDKVILWEDISPRPESKKIKPDKEPYKQKVPPQPEIQPVAKKVKIPRSKTETGTKLRDLLKSKSNLKRAIILKEILDKPISERDSN